MAQNNATCIGISLSLADILTETCFLQKLVQSPSTSERMSVHTKESCTSIGNFYIDDAKEGAIASFGVKMTDLCFIKMRPCSNVIVLYMCSISEMLKIYTVLHATLIS